MKEMVGGCCVCSDERGWPDNPLVYCDGNGCTVAVHQACYGIVTVPTGPWFCRKCESPERQAKVRCELCPSRSGALKRADTGGWAHVVCALYIPEVRFGNVTSMEPIILQLIPQERFNKTCYICQDLGKVTRANIGACMQCNKPGCKQQFHVTCAQGLGLLCEEAGNYLDNVKYCGYCQHHYSKLQIGGRKSSGYQNSSSKTGQVNIKTPTTSSPSFTSPHLQSTNPKTGNTQNLNPSSSKSNSTETLSSTAPTSLITSVSNSNVISPNVSHSQPQKFTSSNFTESVITSGDSVFGVPEQKQTKKRKAITQATAAGAYLSTSIAAVSQPSDSSNNLSTSWETGNQVAVESTPDSTNDEKIKKVKTDLPINVATSSQSASLSASLAEMAKANVSSAHYATTIQASPSTSGISNSNIQRSISHERMGGSTSNIHFGSSQSLNIQSSSHIQANVDQIHSSRPVSASHSQQVLASSANNITSSWASSAMQHTLNVSELPSTSGEIVKHSSIDKMPPTVLTGSSATTSGSGIIRNKKRVAVNPPPIHLHSPNTGSDTKNLLKFSKMEKAPHMLGNELNPDSAAAARLSEQLNAELAAHSVFNASPGPALVPPPLINKATNSSGNVRSSSVLSSSSGSGAQSLDQLLERQWEQGSQFLMEQAQHFDIASLLSCLHQLRTENVRLEEHVSNLLQRRDHLLAVNARLAIPLSAAVSGAVDSKPSRENGGSVRSSPVIRTDVTMVTDRPQQLSVREVPQKPS